MKKGIVIAVLAVFAAFAVVPAFAAHHETPDGNMTINLPAASFDKPKAKTKAPQVGVTFNHKKHGADLKCVGCHHTQPTLGTDAAVKGVSCFSDATKCHGAVTDGKKQNAKDMIHKGSCVKCHKDTVKANAASKAPTACAACHGGPAEKE